ncbi:DHBP synthase RibB-like alpha/beta domain-containing protein [Jimgerdemannia flammicorona]|nr:DHBP synthase RibB-like alpha/beta domain-containing protein [Jimgerdemannia flammicorona]
MAFRTRCPVLDPAAFCFRPSTDLRNPETVISEPQAKVTLFEAAELLRNDEVVAIPTETVYGLAANAFSPAAITKIYATKNRPQDNPLIVHVSSLAMLEEILPDHRIPPIYLPVINRFWPGPLTIILPKSDRIPAIACNQPTVAVRFPSHPIARALITQCGFPLAAPSANSSGKPSPTIASHVISDLDTKIPLVLDGGQCYFGIESTVLDALRSPPAILRPGGVTFEALKEVLGMEELQVYKKHFVDVQLEMTPTTPGMKYRHYSPEAQVVLFEKPIPLGNGLVPTIDNTNCKGFELSTMVAMTILETDIESLRSSIAHEVEQLLSAGNRKFGILRTSSSSLQDITKNRGSTFKSSTEFTVVEKFLGSALHPEQVAHELFKCLREMDAQGMDVILVEGISEDREGLAVMNRLRKAASRIVTM